MRNKISQSPKVYNASDLNYAYGQAKIAGKKKISKLFKVLIIFIIIGIGLFYLFFYSPVFKIKNIVVEGDTLDMTDLLNNFKGQNLILLNSNNIKNKVTDKYGEISDLKVVRGLPNTLKIVILSRTNKIIWQTQNKKYCIDKNGIIYSECLDVENLPMVIDNKDLPVTLNQQIVSVSFLNFISDLMINFTKNTGIKIVNFTIDETTFQVNVYTDQGWMIIFDTTRAAKEQIDDLNKFLESHKSEVKEYIDLRVPGRVYFK